VADLSNDDLRAWAGNVPGTLRSDRHEGTRDVAAAVIRLLDDHARMKPVFDLACKLQDADQCEDHSTGDECEQGEIEHQFFEALVVARKGEPDSEDRFSLNRTDPLNRGEKKRGAAEPSKREHVINGYDDCVSWCPCCLENRSRGLNADGTRKEVAHG
jgi:hypothetical protein